MKIYNIDLNKAFTINEKLAACIGYFDGLHKGHQQLVSEVIKQSKEKGVKSSIITFDPDPLIVIKDLDFRQHLTPLKHKIKIAQDLGVDYLFILDMSKDMMKLSPELFVHEILFPLNIEHLVCGYDFRFGYKGSGDANLMTDLGQKKFDVTIINPIVFDNKKISSTRIIETLKEGDVELVSTLLNRPYSIIGEVVHGRKQGRKIGFPTVNLSYNPEYYTPKEGVYAGVIKIDNQVYRAMINVGHNLTFNHTEHLSIEAYILDFNEDIYGKEVKLYFTHRLRDELKFETVEKLMDQMKIDEINTKQLVSVQTLNNLI